jgi:hypothetical protein
MHDTVRNRKSRVRTRPPFECIALLLQGGGALGAYQAGVYQALAEADLHPDWVAGISIGAINSAIIAGNPPEERVAKLRAFWEGITTNPLFDWTAAAESRSRRPNPGGDPPPPALGTRRPPDRHQGRRRPGAATRYIRRADGFAPGSSDFARRYARCCV